MQPDDLTALCKRLATGVMGWHAENVTIGPDDAGDFYYGGDVPNMECIHVSDWTPITSIAQAFMVAEKIRAQGWKLSLESDKSERSRSGWGATFYRYRTAANEDWTGLKPKWVQSFSSGYDRETPEMAISLAADACLKGKGER